MNRLKDKVCIITGAGAGQGRAAAVLFAKEGAKVVIAEVHEAKGRETEHLIQDLGLDAAFVRADVSNEDDVRRTVQFAVQTYGRVNVLYNNAGIHGTGDGHVTDLTEQVWDRVLNVNLRGMFYTCKYAIPEMLKASGGAIINTGSTASFKAMDATAYAVSKAGILSLTRSVARQFATANVRVNAILPGAIDTEIMRTAIADMAHYRDPQSIGKPKLGFLDRVAKPEEVAYLALYLASDEAAYVTGAFFSVDGGRYAQ